MSEYKPGTVATANFKGKAAQIMRADNGWLIYQFEGNRANWVLGEDNDRLTNIQPLVCLPLTREHADTLDNLLKTTPIGRAAATVALVRDAIRAQTPKPPKRWTVNVYEGGPVGRDTAYLYDRGEQVAGLYDAAARNAQAIADALNAAEATS